jgi:5-methyltetrahydropteroyltriglutamate--homocysteine methyltransferase
MQNRQEKSMAARTKPPFRADHVGSLLRPKELLKAREDFEAGRISADRLREVEDRAVRDVVKMQEDIGLQGVTDGEFRRHDWVVDFKYQLGGVEKLGNVINVPFEGDDGKFDWKFIEYRVDKLSLDRTIFGDHFKFLKDTTKNTAKITLPSPSMMHYPAGRGIDRKVYPDMEVFFADLAAVYRKQIDGLAKLGCTYLQLDDTSLAFLNDPKRRAMIGEGAETQHLRYIQLFNDATSKRPADMAICTHLCRGNYKSGWMASGSYEHVSEALFNGLNVDGFFLEFDDERSGGFEPLRAEGQDGRARPRHHQEAPAGRQGCAQAPHRRGGQAHPHRPALPEPPVRLCVHLGRQCPDPGGPGRQAAPDRGNSP